MTTAVPTNIDPWSVSAPYENSTSDLHNVISRKWVDSPNIRGTLDILQSCVLTLVACIYTVLHLDVPTKTKWHRVLISKVKWSLITLFAPEIVLYMAADQLLEAWNLRKELRKLRFDQSNPPKDFDIDLTYAFFIVMGGVRIDIEDLLSRPDLDTESRWGVGSLPRKDVEGRGTTTVRVSGTTTLWLAGQGHWIKIPRAKITDKSKADTFQKILILIQVSWMVMVMQCIARWMYKLPLALLEIHTMVHVVCAMILYGFWFKKPLNVQDPEVIRPEVEGFEGEIALLLQRQFYTTISASLCLVDPNEPLPVDCDEPLRWVDPETGAQMSTGDVLPIGLALYAVPEVHDEDSPEDPFAVQPKEDPSFEITDEFYNLWQAILATFGLKRVNGIMKCTDFIDEASKNEDDEDIFEWKLRSMPFSEGKRNLDIDFTTFGGMSAKDIIDSLEDFFSWYSGLLGLAVVLSALYGGIYLSAWNWVFPTHWEALVWKFACFLIAAVLPLYHIFNKIRASYLDGLDGWETAMHVVLSLTLAIYMLARIYIIFEAFASLRHVPIGVYMAPVWVQMFPHF